MELARLISEYNPSPARRIDLIAYANEEVPYFKTAGMGSMMHAKSLHDEGSAIEFMISLEMIGFFTDESGSQKYPYRILRLLYPGKGNYIGVIGTAGNWQTVRRVKSILSRSANIPVYSINAPRFVRGIDFSDHASYWHYGFDAVMISDTAFYRNPHYHRASDTIETLDLKRMSEVVEGTYHVVLSD